MNWMLEKCGSLAVLVSLRTILPVAASAMKRSIENTLRQERNAIHRPSGLIAGPTLSSPPSPLAVDHHAADLVRRHPCREHRPVRLRIAACHSSDSSLVLSPRTSLNRDVVSSPAAAAVVSICRMTSSP